MNRRTAGGCSPPATDLFATVTFRRPRIAVFGTMHPEGVGRLAVFFATNRTVMEKGVEVDGGTTQAVI